MRCAHTSAAEVDDDAELNCGRREDVISVDGHRSMNVMKLFLVAGDLIWRKSTSVFLYVLSSPSLCPAPFLPVSSPLLLDGRLPFSSMFHNASHGRKTVINNNAAGAMLYRPSDAGSPAPVSC